jgi:hypothetical protein
MPNTFTLIASSTVGAGGASEISFTSIPNTYTDLQIFYSIRNARTPAPVDNLIIGFNGSYASVTDRNLYGSGSAAASGTGQPNGGYANTAGTTSNTFSNGYIYIPNYLSSNYKSYSADGVSENNATEAYSVLIAGLWSSTSAITSIQLKTDISSSILQYSTAYLYGVKNS